MCSGPFIPLERGGLPSVQWALNPSWERRFIQCAVGPSSLLREEVYLVCAVRPSSLLRDEVYPVCSGPTITTWPCKMRFTQCAASPSSILGMRFGQCTVGPSSITRLKDVSSPSVWRALHSPRVKFTQCAAKPLIPKRWDYQIFPMLAFWCLESYVSYNNLLVARVWNCSHINHVNHLVPHMCMIYFLL